MSIAQQIISTGNSPASALAINGGNYSFGPITALGTTQANAAPLTGAKNYVGTTAASTGVTLLPNLAQGDDIEVYNGGANTLLVYTAAGSGENINALSTTAGFSIATFKSAKFTKVTSTLWLVNLSA